jgi:tetratricopeptide (TPR) repeat protein
MVTKSRTRVVRQRAKGPVDPRVGLRILALRKARALTQGQLAGSDFSKGFISLVETGRTRISLRAAEILAARLGTSASDLLSGNTPDVSDAEIVLLRAESQLLAGHPDSALTMTASLERRLSGASAARLKRLKGRALMETGRVRDALPVLDEAARTFRQGGQRDLLTRTLYDLAGAHARLEEHGEALHLGLQAEELIGQGAVTDRVFELRLLAFLAGTFVTLGDFGAAELRTERAKAMAEDVADPLATADLYENLAVTRQRQGDLEAALTYARRALASYEEMGNQAQIGSSWNTIGWVFIQRGQFARAKEGLDRAEAIATQTDNGRLRAYVLQSRAELALAEGDLAKAVQMADASINEPRASSRCKAISQLVKARALAGGPAKDSVVIEAYEAAFEGLAPHGRRMLARAHQSYFEALSARGRIEEANRAAKKTLELLAPSLA